MPLTFPRAVLFDLDGTLADTAPDLAAAVNRMRADRGLEPAPYETLRPVASAGARGLLGAGFGMLPDAPDFIAMRDEFLNIYAGSLAVDSSLFQGILELLQQLTDRNIAWGIVTNKASRFTDVLVPQIGLGHAACVVSGDTTGHSKPHPAPLFEAARRLNLPPETCWYVGDDLRDIQAGIAAAMPTIAAGWGYCGNVEPASWNADALLQSPLELLALLDAFPGPDKPNYNKP